MSTKRVGEAVNASAEMSSVSTCIKVEKYCV